MAIQDDGWFMNLSVIDRQNDDITLRFDLRAADHAAASAAAGTILAALDGVSSVNVLGYNLLNRFFEDAPSVPAIGDASVKARIKARKTDGYATTFDIPSPQEAIFVGATGANNNIVDVADAAVQAYVDLFKAAGVAFISDGEDLAATDAIGGQRVTVRRGLR